MRSPFLRRFGMPSPFFDNEAGFSPSSLFSSSQPGVWFDPSDLTTLFQDSAGTTPVTTPGQTVGLILDKSQGIAPGPQLVTNGDFASGTGWTTGTGWSISGGQLVGSSVPAFTVTSQSTAALVAGKTYEITYDVVAFTAGVVRVVFVGGTQATGVSRASTGSFREVLVANGGNNLIAIGSGSGGFTGSVDNLSIKEIPGNHATQSTSASRPTYMIDGTGRPYLSFDGVDDGMVTPTITPATDKAQIFAGVRKFAGVGTIVELSAAITSNAGITLEANTTGEIASTGPVGARSFASWTNVQPSTSVFSVCADRAGATAAEEWPAIRRNGVQVSATYTLNGGSTGNFGAFPLYVGRRGGTSQPFNGQIYSMIVRFGANLAALDITRTEEWVNSKTGAY
jgi:hypothetical protein